MDPFVSFRDDGIGDMELDVQAKFLRVLESKSIERLGGINTISANVRIIAATNKDLEKMVTEGSFREDLEKKYIQFAMEVTNNNVSKAARLLGLSRATLRYRLDKL